MTEPTFTVPRHVLAGLVAHNLNQLSDDEPCCADCCAPCAATRELLETGQLDSVLAEMGPGHEWWDSAAGRVDRAWLADRVKLSHTDDGAPDCIATP